MRVLFILFVLHEGALLSGAGAWNGRPHGKMTVHSEKGSTAQINTVS